VIINSNSVANGGDRQSRPRRLPSWIPLALALAALAFAGTSAHFLRPRTSSLSCLSGRSSGTAAPPALAVLFFENLSGDPSLDWLGVSLAERMASDLSQSPRLRVVSPDRVEQTIHELGELGQPGQRGGPIDSLQVARRLADRERVDTVIVGSFSKTGEAIRISVRLQEARTGEILASEKVEGGESALFSLVDDLTQRLKTRLEIHA